VTDSVLAYFYRPDNRIGILGSNMDGPNLVLCDDSSVATYG
jgi:hypothetical protein